MVCILGISHLVSMDEVYKVVRVCSVCVPVEGKADSIADFLLGKQDFGLVWEIVRGFVRVGQNEA